MILSTTATLINRLHLPSRSSRCHFAIKSGGHDPNPGSNNAEDGVTIDLVRLDKVDVAKDRKSVKIGAGLRWDELYLKLERQNLTVVGGRQTGIGVGGLTLGGISLDFHYYYL